MCERVVVRGWVGMGRASGEVRGGAVGVWLDG